MQHELLTNTHKLIAECLCEQVPGCVGPIGDTAGTRVAALRIDLLLGLEHRGFQRTEKVWHIDRRAGVLR